MLWQTKELFIVLLTLGQRPVVVLLMLRAAPRCPEVLRLLRIRTHRSEPEVGHPTGRHLLIHYIHRDECASSGGLTFEKWCGRVCLERQSFFVGTLNVDISGRINPYWKLTLVFKCLSDNVMLDDFKTELRKLGNGDQGLGLRSPIPTQLSGGCQMDGDSVKLSTFHAHVEVPHTLDR